MENLSKLCAEGAIGNLMNVLHCSKQDIDLFWSIVTSPVQSILHALNETHVLKAVQRDGIEIDSIKKSLWILRKKFKFVTTSKLKTSSFQCLKQTIDFLSKIKFLLLIGVGGKHACYHHVDVVWRGMIIDYEPKYTFPLTNDSLTQICGDNTTFGKVSCGYGIFPSAYVSKSVDNAHITH